MPRFPRPEMAACLSPLLFGDWFPGTVGTHYAGVPLPQRTAEDVALLVANAIAAACYGARGEKRGD